MYVLVSSANKTTLFDLTYTLLKVTLKHKQIPILFSHPIHSSSYCIHFQCIWDRRASRSYSLFVAIVLIMTPLVTMAMAYAIIFLKIFRTKKEIMKFDDEKKDGQKRLLRLALRICETFLKCIVVSG